MAFDTSVFTEQIKACFTIMQQQKYIIDTIVELMNKSNLDDTTIGNIEEQLSELNKNINADLSELGIRVDINTENISSLQSIINNSISLGENKVQIVQDTLETPNLVIDSGTEDSSITFKVGDDTFKMYATDDNNFYLYKGDILVSNWYGDSESQSTDFYINDYDGATLLGAGRYSGDDGAIVDYYIYSDKVIFSYNSGDDIIYCNGFTLTDQIVYKTETADDTRHIIFGRIGADRNKYGISTSNGSFYLHSYDDGYTYTSFAVGLSGMGQIYFDNEEKVFQVTMNEEGNGFWCSPDEFTVRFGNSQLKFDETGMIDTYGIKAHKYFYGTYGNILKPHDESETFTGTDSAVTRTLFNNITEVGQFKDSTGNVFRLSRETETEVVFNNTHYNGTNVLYSEYVINPTTLDFTFRYFTIH